MGSFNVKCFVTNQEIIEKSLVYLIPLIQAGLNKSVYHYYNQNEKLSILTYL